MNAAVVVGSGVLGLLVGSFVNVVAHRVPAGASVLRPPSSCPRCGSRIRARHNVPVVGWLVLRGRCFDCDDPISARYPVVEAATGLLFAGAAAVVGPAWTLPAHLWFVAVTVTLVLTDLDHKRIPNRILYPGTVVAGILLAGGAAAEGQLPALGRGLAGGAAYFGLLLVVALEARGGFGFGDVKLAVLLGLFAAFASWGALFVAAFGGFVIGGLVSIVLMITGRAGRKDTIPFGPSMVVGAYVAIAWGEQIVDWYLG